MRERASRMGVSHLGAHAPEARARCSTSVVVAAAVATAATTLPSANCYYSVGAAKLEEPNWRLLLLHCWRCHTTLLKLALPVSAAKQCASI